MLNDYMEAFAAYKTISAQDYLGGEKITTVKTAEFEGALTRLHQRSEMNMGKRSNHITGKLLHSKNTILTPGMQVKRVGDGTMIDVISNSTLYSTPEKAATGFCETEIEWRQFY